MIVGLLYVLCLLVGLSVNVTLAISVSKLLAKVVKGLHHLPLADTDLKLKQIKQVDTLKTCILGSPLWTTGGYLLDHALNEGRQLN